MHQEHLLHHILKHSILYLCHMKKSKTELMLSLGWKLTDYFNNRAMYDLTEHCTYCLFEHRGEIGVYHNGDFFYYNLREDDIKEFTEMLQERENMMEHPKEYTLYQAQQNSVKILYLIHKLAHKNDKDEDFDEDILG